MIYPILTMMKITQNDRYTSMISLATVQIASIVYNHRGPLRLPSAAINYHRAWNPSLRHIDKHVTIVKLVYTHRKWQQVCSFVCFSSSWFTKWDLLTGSRPGHISNQQKLHALVRRPIGTSQVRKCHVAGGERRGQTNSYTCNNRTRKSQPSNYVDVICTVEDTLARLVVVCKYGVVVLC